MSLNINYIPLSFIDTKDEIIKQLRNTVLFSFLLEKYKETTLSEYLDSTQYGYTASAQSNGNHLLVRITDIKNGIVDWENVPFCDCDREDKYLLKKNDILIARTGGTTGKSFIVNEVPKNSVYASYLIRLRLKKSVDIGFIQSFLNSYVFWSQIVEMKSGSAIPNVNAEKLKTLKLPKCNRFVQKELSKAFEGNSDNDYSSIFEKVNQIESLYHNNNDTKNELIHQLDLVKQLRQAFLREAMQGKLVEQSRKLSGPNDESASVLLERIKAEKEQLVKEKKIKKQKALPPITKDEIPFEIPENWVWCRLGDICNYGSSPKAEPSDIKQDTWVLDLEDIEKETSKLLSKVRFNERNSLSTKSKFKTGDVLYSKLRPYLDKVIVADEEGVCTTEILPLKAYSEMNPYYLRFALKRSDFLKYVNSVTKGMKMPRLGTKDGQLALIPLPSLSEQKRIVTKLDGLMQYCDQLEENIKNSQLQNELLLQQVLREALEPSSAKATVGEPEKNTKTELKEDTKVVALKSSNVDYYRRTVLAAEIVWQLQKEPTLGHLKLQKLIYLCQRTANMQLPTNFLKQAMGPYDPQMMRSIDKQLKQKKWFQYKKSEFLKYVPLDKTGEHQKDFAKYFSEQQDNIQYIIDTFRNKKSDIIEITATLYACLEEMHKQNIIYSEAMLLQMFYEWSERKEEFSEYDVKRVFKAMQVKGIVPKIFKN